MKVCVAGLWHLGSVTAACLASAGHEVIGLHADEGVVQSLSSARAPVSEPGLDALVARGIESGRLWFTTDMEAAVGPADVVWVTYDTPVDADDRADVNFVLGQVERTFPYLRDGAVVLISSQVPVGTTRRLQHAFNGVASGRSIGFGYSPENLRLGSAIAVFTEPDRVVVGLCRDGDREIVRALFGPITDRLEWMSVESAEMTKHALNAFLATSIVFINEIAALCEQVGADAGEVARGLKSEARIGPRAYLSPGSAFAGGTLARDVMFLADLGLEHGLASHLLRSVKSSNDAHRQWAARRLSELLPTLEGCNIGVWGLTYKPGTDTLRRSSSVELCEWLHERGANVRAHDPAVTTLPDALSSAIELATNAEEALDRADALVVATPWPDYRRVSIDALTSRMRRPLVLDAARFLAATLGSDERIAYVTVGSPAR